MSDHFANRQLEADQTGSFTQVAYSAYLNRLIFKVQSKRKPIELMTRLGLELLMFTLLFNAVTSLIGSFYINNLWMFKALELVNSVKLNRSLA